MLPTFVMYDYGVQVYQTNNNHQTYRINFHKKHCRGQTTLHTAIHWYKYMYV